MRRVIHWFRRDLRLTDNTALAAAAAASDEVVPVYILSEWKREHHWTGPVRQEFLCGCLTSLDADLRKIGSRLIVRSGAADGELKKLMEETGAEAVFYNRDPDPFGRSMEERVAKVAIASSNHDIALHERDDLLSGAGKPYRVYSPYFRAWEKLTKTAPGPMLRKLKTPAGIMTLPLPTLAHWKLEPSGVTTVEPGEAAARKRLDRFIAGIAAEYAVTRERVGDETSSRLSQDLRWGLLSVRELYARVQEATAELPASGQVSVAKFVREVAWRDFSMQLLYHSPEVLDLEFSPNMRGLPWNPGAGEAFERWRNGQTGFPIVDAAMRQLHATGFMHNRLRIIVAMFYTKDLRMHWRDGEAFFNRHLVDGEIANNNMGWQWCAGVGADAAPYFRIQNPWTQSERHDPAGAFIKQYLPELRDVPPEKLHAPPAPGMRLAKGYPAPMVDHKAERERTLEMFKRHLAKSRG